MSACGGGKSKPAKEVEKLIADIGTVTEDSGSAIEAAEEYYDILTPGQKNEVENYKDLVDARKTYDSFFYFAECPELKRPDACLNSCSLIDEEDSSDSKTYTFSLGEDQIESIVIAKAEEYVKEIQKAGFVVQDGVAAGYYMISRDGEYVATMALNAIEGSGYCMLLVFSK